MLWSPRECWGGRGGGRKTSFIRSEKAVTARFTLDPLPLSVTLSHSLTQSLSFMMWRHSEILKNTIFMLLASQAFGKNAGKPAVLSIFTPPPIMLWLHITQLNFQTENEILLQEYIVVQSRIWPLRWKESNARQLNQETIRTEHDVKLQHSDNA